MTKILILFAVLLTTAYAFDLNRIKDTIEKEWKDFKVNHSKNYKSTEEDLIRFLAFRINREKVNAHNRKYEKRIVSNKLGLNHFSDLLYTEIDAKMKGFKQSFGVNEFERDNNVINFVPPFNVTIPPSMDWRTVGAVTEIKNQGACGSCWSFSAIGTLEGQHYRKTHQLISLSEQNLIDCSSSWRYRNAACEGGFPATALQYIKDNGGIDTEDAYPYKYGNDSLDFERGTCKYDKENAGAVVTGIVKIPTGDEEKLMAAIATVGPIAVALDASGYEFHKHKTGTYYNPYCSTRRLGHAVLVVGYGTDEDGQDYYLLKNSWGTEWGEEGYMKLARNGRNHCGIATMAYYPLV